MAVGPGQVAVPQLEGLSQAEARDALIGAGLTFAGTTEEDDAQTAARASCCAASRRRGRPSRRVRTSPSCSRSGQNTVPSVIGRPQAEAIQALQDAGFDVTTENEESPEAPGTVLGQGGTETRRLDIGERRHAHGRRGAAAGTVDRDGDLHPDPGAERGRPRRSRRASRAGSRPGTAEQPVEPQRVTSGLMPAARAGASVSPSTASQLASSR